MFKSSLGKTTSSQGGTRHMLRQGRARTSGQGGVHHPPTQDLQTDQLHKCDHATGEQNRSLTRRRQTEVVKCAVYLYSSCEAEAGKRERVRITCSTREVRGRIEDNNLLYLQVNNINDGLLCLYVVFLLFKKKTHENNYSIIS